MLGFMREMRRFVFFFSFLLVLSNKTSERRSDEIWSRVCVAVSSLSNLLTIRCFDMRILTSLLFRDTVFCV